ncbi:MAG: helix-turn-helix domain-containing protein [Flavobacteriales bacterium]|nr:helix-turn-helix domain-containing protein [Flavobacteriales bacterium]
MQDLILISVSQHELKCLIEQSVIKALDSASSQASGVDTIQNEYLNIKQASEFTHIAVATLYDYTHKRKIPFSKVGKRLLFSKQELVEWIFKHKRNPKGETGEQANQDI